MISLYILELNRSPLLLCCVKTFMRVVLLVVFLLGRGGREGEEKGGRGGEG